MSAERLDRRSDQPRSGWYRLEPGTGCQHETQPNLSAALDTSGRDLVTTAQRQMRV
jgi:hypothetical protein